MLNIAAGLQRLEKKRRIICDLIETFKLCKCFYYLKMSDYVNLATFKPSRGHAYKSFVNRMHSHVNGHFF